MDQKNIIFATILLLSSLLQFTLSFRYFHFHNCNTQTICGTNSDLMLTSIMNQNIPKLTNYRFSVDDWLSEKVLADTSFEDDKKTKSIDVFTDGFVNIIKGAIDRMYGTRHFARFYALETIARVPYFSYLSVLHLYETLGRWRNADYLKLHFAESWNELHHLLIMEELGGNSFFFDRFFAQHAAFFYYFMVVALYMANPELAYNLNKKVEQHAFQTYDDFLKDNKEMLEAMPVPLVALKYYCKDELFLQQTTENRKENACKMLNSLYDVFINIRDDEAEHALSMQQCENNSKPDCTKESRND